MRPRAPGQILDADIYFNPGYSNVTFATPLALNAHPKSYDLESILTHELGHFLGFSHSAIRSAMMFPYAHIPGAFSTPRPSTQQPDASLGDDDRTGIRVLYPDASDLTHIGSIAGRVLPANPISLPAAPPNVTGIYGAQVVAADAASGAVIAGTILGWSCSAAGLHSSMADTKSRNCPSAGATPFMRSPSMEQLIHDKSAMQCKRYAATPPLTRVGHLNSVAPCPQSTPNSPCQPAPVPSHYS